MDEAQFIREFMALTACDERLARDIYMHTEALGGSEAPGPQTPGEEAESSTPVNPTTTPKAEAR